MQGINTLDALLSIAPVQLQSLGIQSESDQHRLLELIRSLRSSNGLMKQASNSALNAGKTAVEGSSRQRGVTSERPSSSLQSTRAANASAGNVSSAGLNAYGVPIKSAVSDGAHERLTGDRITVCVRKRPLSDKEVAKNERDIAEVASRRCLIINEPKVKLDLTKYVEKQQFIFDEVFDIDTTNYQVYQKTALPLIETLFQGGKATCFAYGQTGSGKTHTMLDSKQGLYMLACNDIFRNLRDPRYAHLKAYVSFYEIYQGQLYDLLNERKKLFAREDGNQNVVIQGITEFSVHSPQDLIQVFDRGSLSRSVGQTGANEDSSRSHAIFQIVMKQDGPKNSKKNMGKFSFIDLAGSERGADRGDADTKTRLEGSEINKSLLALKECIRALDQESRHTPFRQSKLTQVLKDSFIGNCRTCMIATVSPNSSNSEHTLNTLRYADRVKELKGGARPDDATELMDIDKKEDYFLDAEIYGPDANESEMLLDEDFPESEKPVHSPNIESPQLVGKDRKLSILNQLNNSTLPSMSVVNAVSTSNHVPSANAATTPAKKNLRSSKAREQVQQEHAIQLPANEISRNISTASNKRPSSAITSSIDINNPHRSSKESEGSVAPQPVTLNEVNDFIRAHRKTLREITDCSKDETRLLSSLTLQGFSQASSDKESAAKNGASEITDDMSTAFNQYLFDLDRQLERKYRSIASLRSRIKELLINNNTK